MARSYHINLDAQDKAKALLANGFLDDTTAASPVIFRSDVFPTDVICFRETANGRLINVPAPATLKVFAGELDAAPTGGTFTISSDTDETDAIAYNASAATVQVRVRADLFDFGNAIVTGPDGGPWVITATGAGPLAYDLTVDATALSPVGSTAQVINTEGDVDHDMQWEISLFRAYPMFRGSGWTALPSAAVTADITQTGSASANKSYEIAWNRDAYGGTVTLSVLADGTTATVGPFRFNAIEDEIKQAFEAHAGIEVDEVLVKQTDVCKYVVTFAGGSLANSNTPTIATSSNTLEVPVGLRGTLAVSTHGSNQILNGASEATVVFEVEIQESASEPETVVHIDDAALKADGIHNNPGQSTGNETYPLQQDTVWGNVTITSYTGGDVEDLDSIATVNLTPGQYIAFTHATDGLRFYQLVQATTAESVPTTIRPDDYAASTNEKVWSLVSPPSGDAFSSLQINEDFTGYSSDPAAISNGWRSFDSVGTGSYAVVAASGSAWGIVSITTGGSSGDGRHLGMGTVSSNAVFDDLGTIAPWEAWFRFSLSAVTSIRAHVGFLSNPFGAETTCDQIALRFDTGSDSTLKVQCRASGTSTVTDTTVTPTAATFYTLKIWSDIAGTIKFRVYSSAGAALGDEVTISTNVPSTVMTPDFFVHTLTGTARTLSADAFRMNATLSR